MKRPHRWHRPPRRSAPGPAALGCRYPIAGGSGPRSGLPGTTPTRRTEPSAHGPVLCSTTRSGSTPVTRKEVCIKPGMFHQVHQPTLAQRALSPPRRGRLQVCTGSPIPVAARPAGWRPLVYWDGCLRLLSTMTGAPIGWASAGPTRSDCTQGARPLLTQARTILRPA